MDHRLLDHYVIEELSSVVEKNRVAWACIDETQEDLRCEQRAGENLMGYAIDAFYGDQPQSLPFPNFECMILTGTSFNISKALETKDKSINKVHWNKRKDVLQKDFFFRVGTTHQHVRSNTDTMTVLRDYGLKPEQILREAPQYGRMLQGRVKWTAMFADRHVR